MINLNKIGCLQSISSLQALLRTTQERLNEAQDRLSLAEVDVTFHRKNKGFIEAEIERHSEMLAEIDAAEEAREQGDG